VDWPTSGRSAQFTKEVRPISELMNLWHAYRIRQTARFSSHTTFTAVRIFFFIFFWPTRVSILRRMCVCVCVCVHISEGVQTDYELLLLVNNTASEIFVHKSRAV